MTNTPTIYGKCDLCGNAGIDKNATSEAQLGRLWLSVCDAHAYRIASAQNSKAAA